MDTTQRLAVLRRRTHPVLRDDEGGNEIIAFALLAALAVIVTVTPLRTIGTNLVTQLTTLGTQLATSTSTTTTTTN